MDSAFCQIYSAVVSGIIILTFWWSYRSLTLSIYKYHKEEYDQIVKGFKIFFAFELSARSFKCLLDIARFIKLIGVTTE